MLRGPRRSEAPLTVLRVSITVPAMPSAFFASNLVLALPDGV